MIYYQAICKLHGWVSGLYLTPAAASRSASTHRRNNPGPHEIVVQEVYIPTNAFQIRSEKSL